MPYPLFFNWLCVACSPTGGDEESYIFAALEIPTPTWSAEDLQEQLQSKISSGLPHALTLRNRYAEMLSHRDTECPTLLAPNSIIGTWEGGCSSSDNYGYYGTGIFLEIENSAPDIPYDMALQSSFEITDPNGAQFIAGGITTYIELEREGESFFEQSIGGSYQYQSGEGWLAEGVDASFEAQVGEEDGMFWVRASGGVGYPSLKIHFENLQIDLSACEMPYGDLKIRDPSGYWFELSFTDCSGCAQRYWHGEELSEVCIGQSLLNAFQSLSGVSRQ